MACATCPATVTLQSHSLPPLSPDTDFWTKEAVFLQDLFSLCGFWEGSYAGTTPRPGAAIPDITKVMTVPAPAPTQAEWIYSLCQYKPEVRAGEKPALGESLSEAKPS